ncbi:hypothetical protein SCHPADRAFT_996148 [Schizopora paradoxa]|uniref:Microfilament motor n=1 Tax=Schizopora paradoxa TaxID=27342 RepID=A0A0H2RSS5_9AGAM|nr:hypothetical protein SCHPADRAFT_996148 [Schizopora paradoxa]
MGSDETVDAILRKVTSKPAKELSQEEIDTLITLFTPSNPSSVHSKAYLALSALRESSSSNGSTDDSSSGSFLQSFLPALDRRLADVEESALVEALSFTAAMFTVDRNAASTLFTREGFEDSMMDALDLFESSSVIAQLVAQVLSLACGHKSCLTALSPRCVPWLESAFKGKSDEKLKGMAALALLKISRAPQDASGLEDIPSASGMNVDNRRENDLYFAMRTTVIEGSVDLKGLSDAIEGLAYFSTIPVFKDKLSKDSQILKKLISFHSQFRSKSSLVDLDIPGTVPYGLCSIIANLCAYRPKLSDEEAQIVKLKKMAQPKGQSDSASISQETDEKLNDDDHVRERCRRLVNLGAVDLLVSVTKVTDSPSILMTVGQALLSVVENKDNRGRILQSGGAKALMTIIRASHTKPSSENSRTEAEYTDLTSIQALAKLAITSSPMQVFGPSEAASFDAISPLSSLLLHPSSKLLQRFESIMALTNLASTSPELASRVAEAKGLLAKVEFMLLDDNVLVRRAATELICNLVSGSELVFNHFSGEGDGDTKNSVNQSKSRLHILVALSDVEDEPTRLAASGALAVLSGSPIACQFLVILEFENHRVFPVLRQLIDPDGDSDQPAQQAAGLVHRGVVCTRNIFVNSSDESLRRKIGEAAEKQQLVPALTKILKGANSGTWTGAILQPAAEALKWLMDAGVKIISPRHGVMAISKKAGKKVATTAKKGGGGTKVAKADWKEGFKKKQVGVSDMTLLTKITNESVNENLEKRWKGGDIYTYIGGVLISVNPFKDLGIYTDNVLQSYKGKNRLEVPPHVYSIAETAYYNMNAYHENQCVIISGESGAGKTEAAKRIMQYIAAVSGGQDSSIQQIKDMVLATNPLLESFGCAKTLRNNNSSRHGKYLEIMFNDKGEPIGAQITNYLLEKGRVVGQIQNERDFHIFYQFTKAATDEQREAFGIQGPESYAYTSASKCLDVSDIDDTKDYGETIRAMQVIGLSDQEQSEIFRMLAIILWLGNVQFEEKDDGNSQIADSSVTEFIAYLMETDHAMLEKVLTSKVVETQRGGRRGSVYDVPLNPAQASSGRDALSKAIYNNLFEWIVSRINVSMKPRGATAQLIGILDIFGFEIFEDNSFEQLCINYVNEKLQQIFIELTLKTEQEEYVREQIKWTPIQYFNNKVVCDLIEEKRPPGIFAALNDACATAHADPTAADNSFVQRLSALSSNAHFDNRGSQFLVKHYAGDVMYNISGMTDKNKDALVKDLLDLIGSSGNQFLQKLFPDRPDPNSKKRPPTAGDRIKQSAGALVENLMRAQPSYIRTIKPNQNRSSTEFDVKAVLHQIKYLGLQENIRVRRAGFAYRNTFEKIVERFYLLSPATSYAGDYTWQGDSKSGCERILLDTGIAKEEWQMGVTKAFIKSPETLFALETMRDRYWHNMAGRIQRAWRNYIRYRNECAKRIQRFWKNNKESLEYAKVRDYGHQILAGRKERRRFSLLSYRRFMGDYLDVDGDSALGQELRQVCGIGSEKVSFSSRIQILVSKLGRSSKPMPRFLVLTNKAAHIIVVNAKDGRNVMMLERKINLVTIKSISMTNLRDDWVALNCGATEEGDPVFSCVFKTELATHLLQLTSASISVLIGPTITYTKKKEKQAQITAVKDETIPRNDVYKSHQIHVPSGEPPSSLSRPAAKRKPGVVRPITSGKLLRKGGPSDSKPKAVSKLRPAVQALPGGKPATAPAMVASTVSAPVASSSGVPRAPPPPPSRNVAPPPPPPEPDVEMYRAKFAFEGQEGEMSLKKDDEVELVEKDDNGWWMVKKGGVEGWAPSNYLELVPPKPKAAPAPPPPPPAGRRPPAPPIGASSTTPGAGKPTPSAAALKSITANASAKPVSVFPGIPAANGSAAPWKKNPAANGGSGDSSPAGSRPGSSLASKPPPPAVGSKPKPPPVGAKPGAPKIPGKPAVPVAKPQSGAPNMPARPGGGVKPSGGAVGQLDLAAVLAKRAARSD